MLIFVFLAIGCVDKKRKVEKDLLSMQSQHISLCLEGMACTHSENDTSTVSPKKEEETSFHYVIYIDSTRCSPCIIDQLFQWNEFIDSTRAECLDVDYFFIVAPKTEQVEDAFLSIESCGLKNDIYVDTAYLFRKMNKGLPQDAKFHSFVINNENKVILVGDALHSSNIRNLFNKIIAVKDDGI